VLENGNSEVLSDYTTMTMLAQCLNAVEVDENVRACSNCDLSQPICENWNETSVNEFQMEFDRNGKQFNSGKQLTMVKLGVENGSKHECEWRVMVFFESWKRNREYFAVKNGVLMLENHQDVDEHVVCFGLRDNLCIWLGHVLVEMVVRWLETMIVWLVVTWLRSKLASCWFGEEINGVEANRA
jgi:hypothetical protein